MCINMFVILYYTGLNCISIYYFIPESVDAGKSRGNLLFYGQSTICQLLHVTGVLLFHHCIYLIWLKYSIQIQKSIFNFKLF